MTSPTPHTNAPIGGYDLVRVLAAFGIVAFHCSAGPEKPFVFGGVAAFLLMAASLQALRPSLPPFAEYARRRARRILVPWLVWCAVYGVVTLRHFRSTGWPREWTIHWLFVGTAVHLWYFPAIYVGGLGVWALLRWVRSTRADRAAIGIAVAGSVIMSVDTAIAMRAHPGIPYGQWLFSVPGLMIGAAMGLACRLEDNTQRKRTILIAATIGMAGALSCVAQRDNVIGIAYVTALVAVTAALLFPCRSIPIVRDFADVTMGIYAIHPLIVLRVRSYTGAVIPSIWSTTTIVFLISFVLAQLIRRLPGGRQIV